MSYSPETEAGITYSHEELTTFIGQIDFSNPTIQNVFNSLLGLDSSEHYRKVVNSLLEGRISIGEIARLPKITDSSILELIESHQDFSFNFLRPKFVSGIQEDGTDSLSYLMNDLGLKEILQEGNQAESANAVYEEFDFRQFALRVRFSIASIGLGNFIDHSTLTNKIQDLIEVVDIPIFQSPEVVFEAYPEYEKEILSKIYSDIFDQHFFSLLSGNELNSSLVMVLLGTPDRESVLVYNWSKVRNLFQMKLVEDNLSQIVKDLIQKLEGRTQFEELEIAELIDTLVETDFSKATSNKLTYLRVLSYIFSTLKNQENNIKTGLDLIFAQIKEFSDFLIESNEFLRSELTSIKVD